MNSDDEETFAKTCYKCEQVVFDTLNVVYNFSNSTIFLWNKYQIFVYKDVDFKSPEKTFIPEFQIHLIIASNNFLVCLDCNGNIHITSVKFKNSTQNLLKIAFQPRDKGVKTCIRYKEDYILSLKYDAGTYFICFHKINAEFQLEKKIILLCNSEHWPLEQNLKEKYILTSYTTNKDIIEHLQKLFNIEEKVSNIYDLVVLSLDKLSVYGCLFSPKMVENEVTLVKLYQCPAEISHMEIIDSVNLYLLIGLTMGTLIRLSLNDITKAPDIVHLNTALYKMIVLKDSLMYSDGVTMWKTENTFSNDTKFTQFFVTNTKDFAKCGELVVCVTFSNLIYKFSNEDKSVYLIPETADEYCSAEKLMNNSECLNKLFKEIDNNNELVKKLNREQDYITVLSLSNRQDVVGQAIGSSVIVFESYDEANGTEFTITEDIYEYFQADTWLFLVKIVNAYIYNTLNNVISHLLDSISFYITFSSPQQILKTICIQMKEPLKTVSFLIPVVLNSVLEINVNIKIVVNIPGALDKKQQWSVLYRKDVLLSSEHFIKTVNKTAIKSLKKPKDTTENLITKMASIQYGGLLQFTNTFLLKRPDKEWTFYVNLPDGYEQKFNSDEYCKRYLGHYKTKCLLELWSAEEFLKSKSHIFFTIGDERLKIQIQNDGFSNPLLKVTGCNAKMAFNIRNFFANMIYNDYNNDDPGKEFISYTLYATTENLQKTVKDYIKSSATLEEFLPLIDQFEKNVIGALPI